MKKYIIKNVNDIFDNNIDDKVLSNSVIVYVRVSTVSQIEGSSLDYQQKLGIEFFENSDIKFDNIIVLREEGKSGDDIVYDENGDYLRREMISLLMVNWVEKKVKNILVLTILKEEWKELHSMEKIYNKWSSHYKD